MTGFVYRSFSPCLDKRLAGLVIAATLLGLSSAAFARNVIIFVADGLRYGSVNPEDAPTLYELRRQGTHFSNSHAVFPTFTTPNASAIATGHYLGDNILRIASPTRSCPLSFGLNNLSWWSSGHEIRTAPNITKEIV